jgi:hypothetical protein
VTFFQELQKTTQADRAALFNSPVIADCLEKRVTLETYRAFLVQAYHHVRHTVPLLMACGSRLPVRLAWLQPSIVEYIDEEQGHEAWIRDDLDATGADAAALLDAGANLATEVMVSYAYDTVQRNNPIGLFGMIYVLEGTSVALATQVAEIIEIELKLPRKAFRYLRSHGSLDQEHLGTFEGIANRFDDPDDRKTVIHCARVFFSLYAGIFESLPRAGSRTSETGRVAA